MTTLAALFGALPLMLSTGTGAELRQPLGLVMVGGLLLSQVLTLFTTPVIYLMFDRLSRRWRGARRRGPGALHDHLGALHRPSGGDHAAHPGGRAGGLLSFFLLPVAPLPQVDIPTISVSASLPGASPETMASSVATPLERSLGSIAGVTEMTSSSSQGSTRVTLQFDLSRDINGAARDVQAAINAARSLLPTSLRSNPTYHKSNPSDAPIMTLALTSDTLSQGQLYDLASTIVAQKLSQVDGVGEVTVGGSSLPAVRVTVLPGALANRGVSLDDVRTALANANANRP